MIVTVGKAYRDKVVAIQGGRSLDQYDTIREVALFLGQSLELSQWIAALGETGGLVKTLIESGVSTIVHRFKKREGNSSQLSVDFYPTAMDAANKLEMPNGEEGVKYLSWAMRLAALGGLPQAYIFFHGNEGTIAQLAATLAVNMKREEKRKIILIGWQRIEITGLCTFYNFPFNEQPWFKSVPATKDGVYQAVKFLNS